MKDLMLYPALPLACTSLTLMLQDVIRSYYHELDARAAKKEGVFQALKQVHVQGSTVMPTQYLQPFYREELSSAIVNSGGEA